MALVAHCDGGCGVTGEPEDFAVFGLVRKVLYCYSCASRVEAMLEHRDRIHSELAQVFESECLKIVKAFRDDLPESSLPDAPV